MLDSFYLGLDLGQSNDYSALCIAERTGAGRDTYRYAVPWLERFPLHTSYQKIVAGVAGRIHALGARRPAPSIRLVVDSTGVGRPVVDLLRAERLPSVLSAVTITGGDQATHEGDDWSVPKRDLVSTAQVLLQGGRLKIAEALPEAATLTRELLAFKVTISQAGHDSYAAWREGDHDDLVLATALALWAGQTVGQANAHYVGSTGEMDEERGGWRTWR